MNVIILLCFALLGTLIHIGLKFRDSVTKSIKFDLKNQLLLALLTFAIAVAIILALSYMKIQPSAIDAMFFGYSADSIFKNAQSKWELKANELLK